MTEDTTAPAVHEPGFATLAVHAGAQPDPTTGARATPIYQTTSFVFDDVDHAASLFGLQAFGNIYSRLGNPTNAVLEERVAALEGGTAALAVASGHAAQHLVFHTLLTPGDEFIASRKLYGGSINQFSHAFKSFGWNVKWADPDDISTFEAALTDKTKAIFGESIANPGGVVVDIAAISAIAETVEVARKAGVTVVFFQNGWDKDYVEAGGPGSPNWHKSNALKTMRARPELDGKLLAKGGWDYALVDALTPQPADIVVQKPRYSAFFNSQFDTLMRARGIRNLVFCGIATNVCVESTLRDGFHLEYFGILLEDATHQAGPEYVQQATIYNVETFFGWVSNVAEFRRAFAQIPPQDR